MRISDWSSDVCSSDLKNGVTGLDWGFLTGSDSTDAHTAGIWGATKGSLLTMMVTLLLSFPMGVLAAVYLEEFAPRARWIEWIEVSIRSEERRVGKECVRACISRWSPES